MSGEREPLPRHGVDFQVLEPPWCALLLVPALPGLLALGLVAALILVGGVDVTRDAAELL